MERRTRRPVDLHAALGVTVLAVLVVLALPGATPLRVALGLPLLLLVPGYVLVAALFPAAPPPAEVGATRTPAGALGGLERLALSLGLSLAVVPLLGLLLNLTPLGIRLVPVLLTVAAFNLAVGGVALARRARTPEPLRPEFRVRVAAPAWRGLAPLDKALVVLVALAAVAAVAAVGYVALAPRPGEAFTEFYVLGPGGKAEGYPTTLAPGEPGPVILGVANHEHAAAAYRIVPTLVQVEYVPNATGVPEPVERNRTALDPILVPLAEGATRELPYNVTLRDAGPAKVVFDLYKDGGQEPYRTLHLWVNTPSPGATP